MTTIGPMGLGGIDALYYELAEMQDEQRKAARDVRREAQAAQVDALNAQADHTQQAALLHGIGQIVQGAGTAGAGVINTTAGPSAQGQQTTKGWADLASGGGAVGAGAFTIVAGAQEADAQRCAADATAESARAEDAKEVEQTARSSQETFLRRLETAQGLQNEIRNATLRA